MATQKKPLEAVPAIPGGNGASTAEHTVIISQDDKARKIIETLYRIMLREKGINAEVEIRKRR